MSNLYHFGLVDEGKDTNYNLIYLEGKSGKGSNKVASLVDLALTKLDIAADHLVFWANNCGGQNKNKTLAQFFLFLIDTGRNKIIKYKT